MQTASLEEVHQLTSQLQQQLSGRIGDFRLDVRDDGLILKGYARTYYAKQLAQHLIMESVTVPIAANEIEVRRE